MRKLVIEFIAQLLVLWTFIGPVHALAVEFSTDEQWCQGLVDQVDHDRCQSHCQMGGGSPAIFAPQHAWSAPIRTSQISDAYLALAIPFQPLRSAQIRAPPMHACISI
ncbi:MAG: hypothetical protein HWE20_13080 [Gammaproteobacteria bacterium]|nr:hypothetical protein [Gammaproteobacteria bacterium]